MYDNRTLILCNSAFQLLTAIQLRRTLFAQRPVDLLLSDHLTGAEHICENLRQCNVFGNVVYIRTKRRNFKTRWAETCHDLCLIRKLKSQLGLYHTFCIANISVFSILFTRFYQHPMPEVALYEDGFVTYCQCFEHFDKASFPARLLLPKGVLEYAKNIYLFNPQLLEWKRTTIQPISIPKLNPADASLVELLNKVFNYTPQANPYNRPFIFLEESFAADNFKVNDIDLVEQIANIVGRDNLIIKLHPRSTLNRFAPLGYTTGMNTSVPWELVLLNSHMTDSVLISISSSAMLQPYLLLDMPVRSISLLGLLSQKPGNMQGELGIFMQSLFLKYNDICFSPQNLNELATCLHTLSEK